MELHDDDPDHFKFVLKFIYTPEYSVQEIEAKTKIGNDAKKRQTLFTVGAYIVADKYDIRRLLSPVANDLNRILTAKADTTILESIIEKHYSVCSTPGAPVGKAIAPTIISTFHDYQYLPRLSVPSTNMSRQTGLQLYSRSTLSLPLILPGTIMKKNVRRPACKLRGLREDDHML
jgi:hypothetical protein